ncbi:hypothetical protein B0H11DRAFT_1900911 [Mycena galericulata]|nr:hypothetical protein B0H11DRAFT_1900911 [Mycena galericulata]
MRTKRGIVSFFDYIYLVPPVFGVPRGTAICHPMSIPKALRASQAPLADTDFNNLTQNDTPIQFLHLKFCSVSERVSTRLSLGSCRHIYGPWLSSGMPIKGLDPEVAATIGDCNCVKYAENPVKLRSLSHLKVPGECKVIPGQIWMLKESGWTRHARHESREAVKNFQHFHEYMQTANPHKYDVKLMPLKLFALLREIVHLECLCVQSPLRGYHPISLILKPEFSQSLHHLSEATPYLPPPVNLAKTILRSIPERLLPPFPPRARNFLLDALEPHHTPALKVLLASAAAGGPVPNLQHLIIDHGAEIPLTEEFGDGAEVWPDYHELFPAGEVSTHSYGFAYRLMNGALREALREEVGDADVRQWVHCVADCVRGAGARGDGRLERRGSVCAYAGVWASWVSGGVAPDDGRLKRHDKDGLEPKGGRKV